MTKERKEFLAYHLACVQQGIDPLSFGAWKRLRLLTERKTE